MEQNGQDINIMELLLKISNDVSSIKAEMNAFKESQKSDKETFNKECLDIRSDYARDLKDMENKFNTKINNLQTVQNNLVGDVDTLKHASDSRDAKRWRTVIAFLMTALGGLIVGKLPDIIRTLYVVFMTK